jgi:outer membrane immunogenic protein
MPTERKLWQKSHILQQTDGLAQFKLVCARNGRFCSAINLIEGFWQMHSKLIALLGGVLSLGLATSASAADLAARPYTKAPPIVAPIYNWSGFYIGANGGGGWSHKCWDFAGTASLRLATNVAEGCHDADGATAGGQIGYRWQAASWVFGLEAQGNWADFKGSNASLAFPLVENRSKIEAFGFFTGQVGYAWNNALLYVKGGAAVVEDKYSFAAIATGIVNGTASETRWGGVVGVGLEYGFAPNWSIGIEYDHAFMGNRDVTFAQIAPVSFPVDRIRQDLDVVTARINYRFGGPIVARY